MESRQRWRVRAPASVDPKRSARYFRDRDAAESWIRAEQKRLATAVTHDLGDDVTLAVWLGRWFTTTAEAADWSTATRIVYREHLWYWSRLYHVRLRELRTSQLNEVVGLLRLVGALKRPAIAGKAPPKEPRPLSNRTVHAACATLERAIEAARDDGLIDRNPCGSMVRPRFVARKPTLWTLKERRLVYKELERDPLFAAFVLEVEDGLRAGEALGLQWADVDFERRVVLVRRTVHKATVQEWPKNRKPREVALGEYGWRELIRHRDAGAMTGAVWVFCRPDGTHVRYAQLRYRLVVACKRAGVPYKSTHQGRHLHASLLHAAGIPSADIAQRLGHSGLSTLGVYTHSLDENTQRIIEAASSIVSEILEPEADQDTPRLVLPEITIDTVE